mmetsp:Transcript_33561/g.84256  ORF Transcript_33561/g.84256 Transcript_33561/m.84256 type:complete len:633 (+) Transcript_33561:299-2197(+)|eukprot:CAMPEP_0177653318 /NCGR_PEP_ID=MMETSP0447-20121125/13669_1 /TAXON_ID=0 /ORGANISM="Stygamoeba regulata, Strain BSH-02190019" /LENGTH=632 /DNA_ID=CAMNT_0019156761 /DNA_START=196 /DNA_END=2094 /DNA_ORIENTATION=-
MKGFAKLAKSASDATKKAVNESVDAAKKATQKKDQPPPSRTSNVRGVHDPSHRASVSGAPPAQPLPTPPGGPNMAHRASVSTSTPSTSEVGGGVAMRSTAPAVARQQPPRPGAPPTRPIAASGPAVGTRTSGSTAVSTRSSGAAPRPQAGRPPAIQHLRVTVYAAKGLPAVDNNGTTSDPYVIVQYENQPKQKTKVIEEALNPLWNKTFRFPVRGGLAPTLDLVVKDDNLVSDNVLLGVCTVDLTNLQPNKEEELWVPLDSPLAKGGQICLRLYYDTTVGCKDRRQPGQLGNLLKSASRKASIVGGKLLRLIIGVAIDIMLFSQRLILHHLERKKWVGIAVIEVETPFVDLISEVKTNTERHELEKKIGKFAADLGLDLEDVGLYTNDSKKANPQLKENEDTDEKRNKIFHAVKMICYKIVDVLLLATQEACLHWQKRDAHGVIKQLIVAEPPFVPFDLLIKYGFAVDTDSVKRDDIYVEQVDPLANAVDGRIGFVNSVRTHVSSACREQEEKAKAAAASAANSATSAVKHVGAPLARSFGVNVGGAWSLKVRLLDAGGADLGVVDATIDPAKTCRDALVGMLAGVKRVSGKWAVKVENLQVYVEDILVDYDDVINDVMEESEKDKILVRMV